MVKGGMAQVQVSRDLGVNVAAIRRWLACDRPGETLENRTGRGRRSALSRVAKIVIAKLAFKRRHSTRTLAGKLTAKKHLASKSAVQRYLKTSLELKPLDLRKTQDWYRANFAGFWEKGTWPGNSPDMSPIESLWVIVKKKLSKISPATSEKTLFQNVPVAWQSRDSAPAALKALLGPDVRGSPSGLFRVVLNVYESGAGADIGRRHWCVVCMILVVVATTGLISVPLLLRDMARGSPAQRLQLARRILTQVPLVDGHNDFPWNARRFVYNKLQNVNLSMDLRHVRPWNESVWSHTDLIRLRQGHVGAQFWSVYVPCGAQYLDAVQIALEQIDTVKRLVARYPSYTALASSAQDIVQIHGGGRMASLLGVEGGHAIASSLPVLRSLHALGARYLTLTHNCNTPWSEYSEVPSLAQRGLTDIGESVVREMNRLGMVVDLSHASTQTMRDVLAVSRAPAMFSHSSAHALCNISRNVPDVILKQLALQGGIVMISFYNRFLTCGENATLTDVVAHIDHIRRVAGVDHIGLGAGYDGIDLVPDGLADPSTYPLLVAELLSRSGWSETDVKKLVGLNILRVLRKVEEIRDHLSMEEPVSLEALHRIDQHYINNNCTYDLRLQ
ncbi:dipeptidase 1-like [Pollicipes pollicipes]|uniref:dipeptidase 1-like n=1 Tax=Pollicipes pollicipes TaxID=41117 RepID=UPI00188564DD|nr:dipeptidase 1-like [Pollicipes pollicipes]